MKAKLYFHLHRICQRASQYFFDKLYEEPVYYVIDIADIILAEETHASMQTATDVEVFKRLNNITIH